MGDAKRIIIVIGIIGLFILLLIGSSVIIKKKAENNNTRINENGSEQKVDQEEPKENTIPSEKADTDKMQLASSVHLRLFECFTSPEGEIVYPDDYCGSYPAEDGYHILLTSLGAENIKKYNDYFYRYDKYLDVILYEQGKISFNRLMEYSDKLASEIADSGINPVEVIADHFDCKIHVKVADESKQLLEENIQILFDAGEFPEIDIYDIVVE